MLVRNTDPVEQGLLAGNWISTSRFQDERENPVQCVLAHHRDGPRSIADQLMAGDHVEGGPKRHRG